MKSYKKLKFKKVHWLLIGLVLSAVALVILVSMLLYQPSRYVTAQIPMDRNADSYLTHQLLPQLYNGAQRQEPFDLLITADGINGIFARPRWQDISASIGISAPRVLFTADSVVFMGTLALKGTKPVISITVQPSLDQQGFLNLQLLKVQVGAVDVTVAAKMIAKKIYLEQLAAAKPGKNSLEMQIAAALLNDETFEPVFRVEDKKVRMEKITITEKQLTVRLVPA